MSFCNLHVHSHYSVLEGLGSPAKIADKALEHKQTALALTDKNYLYGAIEFYKACKKKGIKPILGCDILVTDGDSTNKEISSYTRNHSLLLLAKTKNGYNNLVKICSFASIEGFLYNPRVDNSILEKYSEDLICLSGDLDSMISQAIINGDDSKAIKYIEEYKRIFGAENFFLELFHNPEIKEQGLVNKKLIELAKTTNTELVITGNSYYINQEDKSAHDILVSIKSGKTIFDDNPDLYIGDYSLKSERQIKEVFPYNIEAIENTQKIADMCNVEFEFGNNIMPDFEAPEGMTHAEYLKQLCIEGIEKKYEGLSTKSQALEQLNYELEMIGKMGFNTYFLIVYDFIKYAKDIGIVVGPGRGSAAGSIVAYSLDITTIDPLKYNLIFERFLNPARVSMPDIDIDFADDRREEVLVYVKEKYGDDKVSQVITFGTMAAKAALKDTGRAMGYPYSEVDKISKSIPPTIQGKHSPLAVSVKEDKELSALYESDQRAKKLLDNAIKLEGSIRNISTHACAVLITDKPLDNYIPLQYAAGNETEVITQYSYKQAEELGLLKMDFLGLRNLTIINNTLKLIKKIQNVDIETDNIPLDDEKAYELLKSGITVGVFQLESAGMRRYLKQLKPSEFEDIIAMISLYRPGPMEWIPDYIKGKHKEREVKYADPSLIPILEKTYGIGVYQEQILKIAQVFAGFSLAEADLLRRAIGKKIASELQAQKTKFIEGALKLKHKEKKAIEIFEKVIEPFAGYGFNKSHAACYAMLSYQTAYLKANYPTEFMAALLTADSGNMDKMIVEIKDCIDLGIKILPPSITSSRKTFTVSGDNEIRFGLTAIKGLGEVAIDEILNERKNGKFKSLEDFIKRVPFKLINKKSMTSLILSGALDEFGVRSTLLHNITQITQFAKDTQSNQASNQYDMFGGFEDDVDSLNLAEGPEIDSYQLLSYEKEYLGMYVSDHPMKEYAKHFEKKFKSLEKILLMEKADNIKMIGVLTDTKKIKTRSGSYMSVGNLEDTTGRIKVTVFPRVYEQYQNLLNNDSIVQVEGKLEDRNGEKQVVINKVQSISLEKEDDTPPYIINIPKTVPLTKLKKLKDLLMNTPGNQKVEIHIGDHANFKKIGVPYKIDVNKNMEYKIKKILSNGAV